MSKCPTCNQEVAEPPANPLPCPWCGGATRVFAYSISKLVVCENTGCRAMGPYLPTPQAAVAEWNRVVRMTQGEQK